jgi:peroxiredoxin
MGSSNRQGWFLNLIIATLVVGVVVVMGLLIMQNRALKAELAAAHSEGEDLPHLEVGERLDPVTLSALDGTEARLDFDTPDSETLLLFFSPDCPACDTNFVNWIWIEEARRHANRRIVFISTVAQEKTRQYIADKELQSEVLIANRSVLDSYKIFQVPTTVLVGNDGVVSAVWSGILPDEVAGEL